MKEIERKSYPTDLTDKQWKEIARLYKEMPNCRWSKRELTDAVLHLVDSRYKWRQLPLDFPPYSTVHSFYQRPRIKGLWYKILQRLVKKTRINAGRQENPSYAIIHPQSMKTVAAGEERGIDGEKTRGRKRHIVVDVLACLLSATVHAASIHDTKGGIAATKLAFGRYSSIQKFRADAEDRDTFVSNVKEHLNLDVDILERIKPNQ